MTHLTFFLRVAVSVLCKTCLQNYTTSTSYMWSLVILQFRCVNYCPLTVSVRVSVTVRVSLVWLVTLLSLTSRTKLTLTVTLTLTDTVTLTSQWEIIYAPKLEDYLESRHRMLVVVSFVVSFFIMLYSCNCVRFVLTCLMRCEHGFIRLESTCEKRLVITCRN